jgi:hypothetical protein
MGSTSSSACCSSCCRAVRACRAFALLQALRHPHQRGLQALQAHGLGQVVDRVELEGLHRMARMRRDEDHQRRPRVVAQRLGQHQAVGAGHLHVEQHQVAAVLAQPGLGGAGGAGLGQHLGVGVAAAVEQRPQARAGQRLVVNQQHADGGLGEHGSLRAARVHRSGNRMRTLKRRGSASTVSWAATSYSRRRRSLTLASARPWPPGAAASRLLRTSSST